MISLSQKESTLIKDLKGQEQICIEKYAKYASQACDGQLKNLLSQIAKVEQNHLNSLTQMESGNVPSVSGGMDVVQATNGGDYTGTTCNEQNKKADTFLCSDLLSTEKHVSSLYDTCVFEFKDVGMRNVLNHIQKEEQEHGEKLYHYMEQNGMY